MNSSLRHKGEKKIIEVIIAPRPKAVNVLCYGLMNDVSDTVEKFENDETVGIFVITGHESYMMSCYLYVGSQLEYCCDVFVNACDLTP